MQPNIPLNDAPETPNPNPTPTGEPSVDMPMNTFDMHPDLAQPPRDPSQPFTLPIQPSQKSHKGLIAIIAAIVVVLGLSGGAAALYLVPTLMKKDAPVSKQVAVAAPKGWKQFATKKFGISFITPEKWSVNEFDPQALNTGANGVYGDRVSIYVPDNHTGTMDISVTRAKLKAIVDEHSETLSDAKYKATAKATKWRGYDAIELTTIYSNEDKNDSRAYVLLYVQIGDYVFTFPEKDNLPPGMEEKYVPLAQYNQFVDSIRVDKAVVDAQGKEDSKPVVLKQGKDVNLGAVVIPAGWKKVTSKYGITYAAPTAWIETAQTTGLSGGAVCFITVETFDGLENLEAKGYATLGVYSTDLDTVTNQSAYMAGAFGGGVSSVTEKLKWNGYDARRIVATAGGKTQSILYVHVGKYTYNIPDANDTATNPFGTKVDTATARAYVNSIRITAVK